MMKIRVMMFKKSKDYNGDVDDGGNYSNNTGNNDIKINMVMPMMKIIIINVVIIQQ